MSPGGGGSGSYFRLAVPGRRKQPGNLSMNLVKPAGQNLEANFDPSSTPTPTRASRPSRCVRIRARRGAPRIHGLGRRARDSTAFVGGYVLSPKPLLRHFHIAAMVGGGKPLGDSLFAGHAAAGAAAISASAVAVHPLDTVKTLIQLSATGPKQKIGLRQVVDRLMSASGPAGLYSGIGWSMLGKLPSLGARFGTYELLTAFYKDGREDNHVYYSETMLAGIAAGAVEAFLCTPFELLKLRTQVGSAIPLKAIKPANVIQGSYPLLSKLLPGYVSDVRVWNSTVGLLSNLSPKHPDIMGALKQHPWMLTGSGKPPLPSDVQVPSRVVALEGWGALWRGLRPGIARDCVFSGMFFSTWQFIDTAMLTWKAVNMKPEPRNLEEAGPVSPFASSLAAGFSGVVAAAASHTFDTAKSRSQCTVIPKYIAMERRFLKWKVPGMWIEQMTGISPTDRNVLFRGIGLRMARSGIASFVLVGSYYFAIDCIL